VPADQEESRDSLGQTQRCTQRSDSVGVGLSRYDPPSARALCAANSRYGGRCGHLRNLGGKANELKRPMRGKAELRRLHRHLLRRSRP
jgi:hypothetical protein